ncbi:MAG: NUDIX hydrolase [Ancalomicrobiaceae bacterium]|nr:NUDIX hydrolase [Ancalomicrobiaceae bacterium]
MSDDLLQRLNAVDRSHRHANLRPKDAATLMILDRAAGGPARVLMGRRHRRHAFLPGAYVFPGGKVDAGDSRVRLADDYHPAVLEKLMSDMKGRRTATRARAFGVAALRETFEEAGLFVGRRRADGEPAAANGLAAFAAAGVVPSLAALRLVARAITPPGRLRRFDTRFFAVAAAEIAGATADGLGPSGELEDVAWLSFEQAGRLDLPSITLTVIAELQLRLETDAELAPDAPAPYYRWHGKGFIRSML